MLGAAVFACAFGLVWYMWWLAALGAAVALAAVITRSLVRDESKTVPAEEVRQAHLDWIEAARTAPRSTRVDETAHLNFGRAIPLSQEGA